MFGLVPSRRRSDVMVDPFRRMDDLVERLWQGFPLGEIAEKEFETEFMPNVDISETDKQLIVKAELPGIAREDIDISLDEGYLIIKGEKKQEKEESGKHFHRVERAYGSFHRSLRLPTVVEKDKIEATFKDGVLTVVLPKSEEAKKKITHVSVH